MQISADVLEEWCGGEREDTSEEITSPAVTTSRRR